MSCISNRQHIEKVVERLDHFEHEHGTETECDGFFLIAQVRNKEEKSGMDLTCMQLGCPEDLYTMLMQVFEKDDTILTTVALAVQHHLRKLL